MKVAQIGRRLAEHVCNNAKLVETLGSIDPERVEAAALVHDLGHPPFGHTAEKELDRLITAAQVPDGFEGNAQAFRIVTRLAIRDESDNGLNLTRATLNATLKYPWTRRTNGLRNEKWGVYSTEEQEFDWVKEPFAKELFDLPPDKRSAEAEIMDWADDIAYAVHDMEDFYRAGLIPMHQLAIDEGEVDRFFDTSLNRLKGKTEYDADDLKKAFRTVVSSFVLGGEPYQGTQRHRAALRSFTSSLIGQYITAIAFDITTDSDWKARRDPTAEIQVEMLKQLTWNYVIQDPALETQQYGQRRVVRELFEMYKDTVMEGASGPNRGILSRNQQETLDRTRNDRERISVVGDIIASMTEQQALQLHQRLTGVSPGSVLDALSP